MLMYLYLSACRHAHAHEKCVCVRVPARESAPQTSCKRSIPKGERIRRALATHGLLAELICTHARSGVRRRSTSGGGSRRTSAARARLACPRSRRPCWIGPTGSSMRHLRQSERQACASALPVVLCIHRVPIQRVPPTHALSAQSAPTHAQEWTLALPGRRTRTACGPAPLLQDAGWCHGGSFGYPNGPRNNSAASGTSPSSMTGWSTFEPTRSYV
jgi:hypothetical protein